MSDKRISQLVERTAIENNDVLPIVALGASTTNKVTISTIEDWMQSHLDFGVTSIGITETAEALSITGSPVTSAGNINIAFTGTSAQYVKGDGSLATIDLSGYVPTSRTLTINGTAYDLSANRSWSVGSVTSIGLITSANALSITGSPITGSGNISLNFSGTTAQYVRGDGSLATFPSIASEAQRLITEVYNKTGATLTKGTIVYINGGQGNLPSVTKAIATSDSTSAQTYGVVQSDITNNNNGYVVVSGSIINLDTQAYTDGTQLYLSGTTAGAWTSTKPHAPIHLVYIGIVTRSHPTQGVIEVKIQNGYEFEELHDVSITSVANNDGIFYNSSNDLWENKTIAEVLGYTPANTARNLTINGTTYDLTADRTWNVGTVTSIALSAPTGFSVSGSPVTGSGTLALSFATGYSLPTNASQTNWDTAYTNRITSLTTTGSSGAATLLSNTLNIPNYTLAGLGGVPTTRTLTINGTAYDLSADRSWTIVAGISSVSGTAPISVSTTSGAATISITKANTTTDGYLSSTDWNTFNNKQNALTNPVTGTGTNNFIPKFTSTGSTIGDSIMSESGGYLMRIEKDSNNAVGLAVTNNSTGTSAQSYLTLNVGSAGYFNMGKVNTTFTAPAWLSSGDAYLYNETAGNIVVFNGFGGYYLRVGGNTGTANFSVLSNGNVGIGGSPSHILDVFKSLAGDAAIRITNVNTGTSASAQFFASNGTTTTQFFHLGTAYTGTGVLAGAADAGGVYNNTTKGLIFASAASTGNIRFATGGLNQTMILNSSGNLGLGINTLNFEQANRRVLDINGTSDSIIALSVGGNAKGYIYHAGGAMSIANYTSGERLNFNTRTAGGVDTTWASILSTGTFLVGTDSGSSGLTGATVTIRASSNNVGQTAISIQGYDKKGRWAINGQNSTDNYDFAIYSAPTGAGDWTQRFTIQPDGIIYIGGTVSGGGKLQVNGDVNINGNFRINGTIIGGGGGSGVTGSGTTNYATKWTSASTLGNGQIYDNGTNVIIGSTSATNNSRFEIIGNGVWNGAVMSLTNTGTGGKSIALFSTNSSFTQGAGRFLIYNGTDNIDMLTLTSAGNLLLGTTNDNGYRLNLNGSISFTYGYLNNFRGSSSPNDILVGNDGSRFYIGGNTYVAGSVTATGGFFDSSDARLKTLVTDNYLNSEVVGIKAKLYRKNGKIELGYYAQDLQNILPSSVLEDGEGFLSLSYSQVHTAKIAVIEDEVTLLKRRVSDLESKLLKYEA